jgi:hypothetical protein
LWSKSTYALKAARSLRPGQQISAIVGLNSLTMKKRLLQTLKVGGVCTWAAVVAAEGLNAQNKWFRQLKIKLQGACSLVSRSAPLWA